MRCHSRGSETGRQVQQVSGNMQNRSGRRSRSEARLVLQRLSAIDRDLQATQVSRLQRESD
jgi:hypothetical protein